jgi:putative membrane protein
MHDGNWHSGMGDSNGWWFLMVIMMVVFWGGLIWIGITLLKHNHPTAQTTPPNVAHPGQRPSPQEILAERLARSEIDTDDYRQRLDALRDPPTS